MNLVIVSGRLGGNPESITKGWKFSLAVKDINTVHWVEVLNFDSELITTLKKGDKVLVTGRFIETNKRTKIVATRIEFI